MAYYNFEKDLDVAKKTELDVAKFLQRYFNAEILDISDKKYYDILLRPKGTILNLSFEIKEDFMCETTGNVALEFSCRGKPSGIATTRADYYVYKLHTKNGIKYVLHTVNALKKIIEEKKYIRVVNGGDEGSNSLFYLFKYSVFIGDGEILPLDKTEQVWYNKELL